MFLNPIPKPSYFPGSFSVEYLDKKGNDVCVEYKYSKSSCVPQTYRYMYGKIYFKLAAIVDRTEGIKVNISFPGNPISVHIKIPNYEKKSSKVEDNSMGMHWTAQTRRTKGSHMIRVDEICMHINSDTDLEQSLRKFEDLHRQYEATSSSIEFENKTIERLTANLEESKRKRQKLCETLTELKTELETKFQTQT